MDVFEHDDGVVHDKADRHHECEQGQHVDRQAKRQQHGEGGDQRDRNRYRWNEGRPERAQEDEDHADNQRNGDPECDEHLVDRGVDEGRPVEVDYEVHVFRQRLDDFRGASARFLRHLDDVGRRLLDDADADSIEAVCAEDGSVFFRAEFDTRHIAEANRDAVSALGDDELLEFVRRAEGAVDAVGEDQIGRRQRACRRFHVFRPHGAFDVANRQTAGRDGAAV